MSLKGSKTEENLKAAFAGESQANRRYLYFAQKADIEGYNDVATVFRSTAEGETGHAHGHLEYLEQVGDPATGKPIVVTSSGPFFSSVPSMSSSPTSLSTFLLPSLWKTSLFFTLMRRMLCCLMLTLSFLGMCGKASSKSSFSK